ncbi:MAG TPA: alpha/beta hydrolase [Flavisolibacter sp.]|nr:alpha/beta hydrolase [Flavisolibacter sp.]
MKSLFLTFLFVAAVLQATAGDSTFYFTTSDNVKLYVRIAGHGTPCLFVHGGPGSTSYYYEAMAGAPLIEEKLQMIYYDQRGAGRSDSAANRDYSLKRMLLDMDELRQHLKLQRWSVMGHSFGGILLTNYALQYAKNITAMFYIHATVNMQASMQSHVDFGKQELGMQNDKELNDESKPLMQRVSLVHNRLSENNSWYKLMYRNAAEKKYNDSVTLSSGKFNRDFATQCWNIEEYWKDYSAQTANIKCPVLIITGKKDYAVGVNHYKSFRFPAQTVVHYIGGHASFQEEPQWYAEKILSFAAKIK